MNRLSGALATVAVLALAGCGGSGNTAGPVSTTAASQSVTAPAPVAVPKAKHGPVGELHEAAVAAGHRCPSWVQDNVVTLAAGSGHCSDADVFTTYASPGQLKAAVDRAKANIELPTKNSVEADPNLVGKSASPTASSPTASSPTASSPTQPSATLRETCSEVEKAFSGLSGKSSPPTASELGAALAKVKLISGAGDTETRSALSALLEALPGYRDEDPAGVVNVGRRAFLNSLANLADRCMAVESSALRWVG
jgi:hypothetical protein